MGHLVFLVFLYIQNELISMNQLCLKMKNRESLKLQLTSQGSG